MAFLKRTRGGWSKSAEGSYETRGKTLGIVGYGSIGSQLSVLAESLGMYVIYYDAVTKLPLGNARQVGTMDELFNSSKKRVSVAIFYGFDGIEKSVSLFDD